MGKSQTLAVWQQRVVVGGKFTNAGGSQVTVWLVGNGWAMALVSEMVASISGR